MQYPYDSGLSKEESQFLKVLRKSASTKDPHFSIDFLEDNFPNNFRALLHTYAYHRFFVAIDDVWFQASQENTSLRLSDLYEDSMGSLKSKLDGISPEETIVIAVNTRREVYYLAGAKRGDKRLSIFRLQMGDDDGSFVQHGES